ncbi:uncharacterized protein [Macrobrachium rosenbergii]|uniref:uncharacterized protein n=1 Tax=Macrobrachium rosenbergii TaxID=79674 RepID=UPI0034D514A2
MAYYKDNKVYPAQYYDEYLPRKVTTGAAPKQWDTEYDRGMSYYPAVHRVIDQQPRVFTTSHGQNGELQGAPRYGRISAMPDQQKKFYFDDFQLLSHLQKVVIGCRRDGCYTVSDTKSTLLYFASLRSDTNCCGCEVPKGPGIAFKMFTSSKEPILVIQTYEQAVCCSANDFEGDVKILPDLTLGTMAGSIARGFELKSLSSDRICTINAIYDGFCLWDRFYEIVPVTSPHDIGTILVNNGRLLVTFPRVLDVPRRAFVLACIISMKYQLERKGKTGPCKSSD